MIISHIPFNGMGWDKCDKISKQILIIWRSRDLKTTKFSSEKNVQMTLHFADIQIWEKYLNTKLEKNRWKYLKKYVFWLNYYLKTAY